MLGGLYGDLPPPSTSTASSSAVGGGGDDDRSTSSWLSSAKLMAPPALRKPAATLLAPPQPLLRNQHQSLHKPKPSNPSPQSVRPTVVTASVLLPTDDDVVVVRSSAPSQPALVGVTSSVMEEYDPARPNDYEEYRKERKRKVAEEEMKREMERRRREEEERELELEREREKEREANQRDRERELNISGEEAWRRRAAMSSGSSSGMGPSSGKARSPSPPSNGDGFSIVKSGNSGLAIGAGGQMTAAQKMMAKMGWKEGQGLGKQEQGITTPLIAKKTDRRAGVIVNASETSKKPKSVSFNGPPTCVVLLRNMVGPGEVDDELESEVADECTKYGSVVRVLIFEITEPGFPDDEAVRIYIKFARSEDATKALIELEGRYFGGRLVRATFFDEDKFDRNELAPMPGEIPGYF